MSDGRAGVILLLAAGTLWSASGLLMKVTTASPVAVGMWRSAGAAMAMAALLPMVRGAWPTSRIVWPAVLAYTCNVSAVLAAMRYGTAAEGILLQYTGPAWCALLARVLLGRPIQKATRFALGLAMTGILVMLVGRTSTGVLGPLLGMLSGCSFGALILLLDRVDRGTPGGADPVRLVLLNNLGAAVLLLVLMLVTSPAAILPGRTELTWLLLAGTFTLALPYVLFQIGLRRTGPVAASLLILIEPMLNPLWVAWQTNERPDAATVGGGALLLGGLVVETIAAGRSRPAGTHSTEAA